MQDKVREYGEVKFLKTQEGKGSGYGFITPDQGGDDIFFHITKLEEGTKSEDIKAGVKVGFYRESGKKGPIAVEVGLINQ